LLPVFAKTTGCLLVSTTIQFFTNGNNGCPLPRWMNVSDVMLTVCLKIQLGPPDFLVRNRGLTHIRSKCFCLLFSWHQIFVLIAPWPGWRICRRRGGMPSAATESNHICVAAVVKFKTLSYSYSWAAKPGLPPSALVTLL